MKHVHDDLPNGLRRYYNILTDGGGEWMRTHFIKFIETYGQKEVYDRCYEWCSGSAPIGFAMLDHGLTKHLTCHDNYDVAIDDCLSTAKFNNIENKVDAFLSNTVAGLPETQPWDLVVSNPPHCWYKNWEENDYLDRILLDQDKQTHLEFFKNILDRVTDDCDIFIAEQHDAEYFIPIAQDSGLKFIDMYRFDNSELHGAQEEERLDQEGNVLYLTWDLMHFRPQ
jgi:methylase of polypeptide subunit release factors